MMKELLLASTLVSLLGFSVVPAFAQVEPRVIGNWNMAVGGGSPPRSFRIDSNGHYESVANGQVIDSGTISLNNGQWKRQSTSGRSESGDYGVIGGKLQFYSGSLTGIYSKGPVAPVMALPPGQTVQYTESGVEVRTVRPGAYVSPIWRKKLGKMLGQPQQTPPGSAAPATTSGAHSPSGAYSTSGAPQRLPKGGYIPVMKDNKARQYYNGF